MTDVGRRLQEAYDHEPKPGTCEGRRRLTRGWAHREAKRLRQRAYECRDCRGWHLTNMNHDGARW